MLIWLGSSLVFFYIVVPIKNYCLNRFVKIVIATIFLFALLWRHNAIISIYPLFILFVYLFLKNREDINHYKFILRFILIFFLCGLGLVIVVKTFPHILSKNIVKYTANHIFLHQIAANVVPENDSTMIPEEWYAKGKNFQDVKKLYNKHQLLADPFHTPWAASYQPFKFGEIKRLKIIWLKSILKYPANYLRHIYKFINAMWFQEPGWILNAKQIQNFNSYPKHVLISSNFPEDERKITFSQKKKKIYVFLLKNRIVLNHIIGVYLGFILLIINSCLWIIWPKIRCSILLYSLSYSISACFTAVGVCAFSPTTYPRYMAPVLILSLISFIAFLTFLCLRIPFNIPAVSGYLKRYYFLIEKIRTKF